MRKWLLYWGLLYTLLIRYTVVIVMCVTPVVSVRYAIMKRSVNTQLLIIVNLKQPRFRGCKRPPSSGRFLKHTVSLLQKCNFHFTYLKHTACWWLTCIAETCSYFKSAIIKGCVLRDCMIITPYYTSVNFGVSFAKSQVLSENRNSTHIFSRPQSK